MNGVGVHTGEPLLQSKRNQDSPHLHNTTLAAMPETTQEPASARTIEKSTMALAPISIALRPGIGKREKRRA